MNGFDVVRGGTGGGVFLYATRHDEHCFKSSRHKAMRAGWGSETQRPGRDRERERRGEEETRSRGGGDRGRQRSKEGAKSPRQRSRLKEGPSALEPVGRPPQEIRGTERWGEQSGDSDPESGGARREYKDRQRQGTN
jgi:hypothetical protein